MMCVKCCDRRHDLCLYPESCTCQHREVEQTVDWVENLDSIQLVEKLAELEPVTIYVPGEGEESTK